jgi:hypothetical protein
LLAKERKAYEAKFGPTLMVLSVLGAGEEAGSARAAKPKAG